MKLINVYVFLKSHLCLGSLIYYFNRHSDMLEIVLLLILFQTK